MDSMQSLFQFCFVLIPVVLLVEWLLPPGAVARFCLNLLVWIHLWCHWNIAAFFLSPLLIRVSSAPYEVQTWSLARTEQQRAWSSLWGTKTMGRMTSSLPPLLSKLQDRPPSTQLQMNILETGCNHSDITGTQLHVHFLHLFLKWKPSRETAFA